MSNISVPATGAPAWWGGTPPNYPVGGITGKGVIVGIIDTGIDLAHADFRTAANLTRVKYVWNQMTIGTGPPGSGYNYGTEYTEAQINAGSCPQTDSNGHGTHMAGIAAANGRATGNGFPAYRYVGVAPEADLVIVKMYYPPVFTEQNIIDGADYVFQKAQALGKACVLLIAAGHNNKGAHDGTYALDVALSALTGPGKIIVAAAGDQGGKALHSQVNLASGQSATITFTAPTHSPTPDSRLDIEGWHEPTAVFNAKLTSPNGFTTGWIAPGVTSAYSNTTDGGFTLYNDVTTNSKGAKQVRSLIEGGTPNPAVAPGTWSLELERHGTATTGLLDAWISFWRLGSGGVSPVFTSNVNMTQLVMSPATADSVISVGAYTTKNEWTSLGGGTSIYSAPYPVIGNIATLSSLGMRRDGVQRPDLTAPGEGIMSSMSASAAGSISNTNKDVDGVHRILRETNVAAAHVAGALALLLQGNQTMTPSDARELLIYYSNPVDASP